MSSTNPDQRRREAARRALEEAKQRREQLPAQIRPSEQGGRDGPEPTRYGDWEKRALFATFDPRA